MIFTYFVFILLNGKFLHLVHAECYLWIILPVKFSWWNKYIFYCISYVVIRNTRSTMVEEYTQRNFHEKQIPMHEWICMKWPHISILDQHAWAYWNMVARGIVFLNSQTICANINGFQIPAKTSCIGHRWRKAKDFFVFCSGKICLVCFHGLLFCFILCLLHKINAQTPITTNLST